MHGSPCKSKHSVHFLVSREKPDLIGQSFPMARVNYVPWDRSRYGKVLPNNCQARRTPENLIITLFFKKGNTKLLVIYQSHNLQSVKLDTVDWKVYRYQNAKDITYLFSCSYLWAFYVQFQWILNMSVFMGVVIIIFPDSSILSNLIAV